LDELDWLRATEKRRYHSPEFKFKVAVVAIQVGLTMSQLVKKLDVHAVLSSANVGWL